MLLGDLDDRPARPVRASDLRLARRSPGRGRACPAGVPAGGRGHHSLRSNSRRTPALVAQQLQGVRRVAGRVAVADQHGHVGGQPLGAQRGGGERGGHGEEDDRAALGGGQDRAALAAGHVDADDGDVGRAAGGGRPRRAGRSGRGRRRRRPRRRARPVAQQRGLGLVRHDADRARGARVRRAAARLSEPDLPAPPIDGDDRALASACATCRHDARGQGRGAADVHHGQAERGGQVVGDDGGDRAAEEDGVAVGGAPARCGRPSAPGRPRSPAGSGVRETRVATRSPTSRPSGDSGPTSSTVPTSMPPEPVTGFCILPRAATISSTSRRTASPSSRRACVRSSWRNDAASRLSRLDPDPHLVGPQLAAGVEPLGRLRQHRPAGRRGPGAARSDRWPARRNRSGADIEYPPL